METKQPTISLIIPTIGRSTLKTLLGEAVVQLQEGDEILVVGDGPHPEARKMAEEAGKLASSGSYVRYFEHGPSGFWGTVNRNWVNPQAKGDYLWALDDDDRCAPTAFSTIRSVAVQNPRRVMIFMIYRFDGLAFWFRESLEVGNISTQMIVIPNLPGMVGQWGQHYNGECDYIMNTLKLYPEKERTVLWRREIVALHGWAVQGEVSRKRVENWKW